MDPLKETQSGPPRSGPVWLAKVENAAVAVSAVAVLLLCGLVTASVLGRTTLLFKVPDHIIFSGEFMVALVALPWAAVAREKGHIAVEVFTNRARPSMRLVLVILASLIGIAMIAPLGFSAYETLMRSITRGSYYDGDLFWPEWPGRLVFTLGFLLLAVRLVVELWRALRRLGRGSLETIDPEDGYF